MAIKKFDLDTVKERIMFAFIILLLLSLFFYFGLGTRFPNVNKIMPEFMGISLFSIILFGALHKKINKKMYMFIIAILLTISIALYVIGIFYNIIALQDIMPEMIGGTAVAFVFSLLFNRKFLV